MKIHSMKQRKWEVFTLSIGLVLSLFLIRISPYFLVMKIPYEIAILIHFLCGIFVLSAIGMLFEEDSRIGGLLLVAISIPILFAYNEQIIFEGFLFGIGIGCILSLYGVLKNRFDVLAETSKTFMTGFFIILIVSLFYGVVIRLPTLLLMDVYKFVILLALMFSLYISLLKTIRGIKARDVVVFGPKSSGKTYLLLAFYEYFVNFLDGKHKEVIISREAETLRIDSMLQQVNSGKRVRGTLPEEIAMYT